MKAKKHYKIHKTKNQIEIMNGGEPIIYSKDPMKIRFESDDDLTLYWALNILNLVIIAVSVFEKDVKYYPEIYLHECLHEL